MMRMIPALAFVPVADLVVVFEELKLILPPVAVPVVDYFESTYIGVLQPDGRNRDDPLFAHATWNVYTRTLSGRPRTNNHIEGYRRRFSSNVNAAHPGIYNFLEVLRKEEHLTRAQIEQMVAGQVPPPPKKKYRDLNSRIVNIVGRYGLTPGMDYLRGIAYNYNF